MDSKVIEDLSKKISYIESSCDTKQSTDNVDKQNLDDVEFKKCYKRISLLVSYKERCVEELRIRLVNKEKFSEKVFERAIKKAQKADIVNDERYSEIYALSKFSCLKGIDGVLKHFDRMKIDYLDNQYLCSIIDKERAIELNKAINVLENKKPRSKNVYASAINKLINRGFSMSISISAAKKWVSCNSV